MPGRQNSIIRLPTRRPGSARKPERAGPRPPGQGLPRYLTQEELGRFRPSVVAGGSARDVALFGVMYRYGLRASATTLLLMEDLDLARGRVRIRRANGGDPKEYPLPRDLMPAIRRYLRKR